MSERLKCTECGQTYTGLHPQARCQLNQAYQKRNKYGAKKVEGFGRRFDSQLERAVYAELLILEQAKDILDLRCQVQVKLTDAQIIYKADFAYRDPDTQEQCFAEAKGFETDKWELIKKLWKYYGPGILEIYKGSVRYFKVVETIVPIKRKK